MTWRDILGLVQGQPASGNPTAQRVRAIVLAVSVGVAYFVAARLSLLLMTAPGVAVFWPAAGVSSGILIALGRTARWPVAAGVIAANMTANLMADRNVLSSSIFSLSDAGEALLVAWLIERFIGRDFSLGRLHHVLGLLAATLVGTAVSGVGGALGYELGHNSGFPAWTVWWQWFASDFTGIIAVAPLIIGLAATLRAPPSRRELVEGALALIAIAATTAIVIVMLPAGWFDINLAVVLLFPVVLWIAARCRPVIASAAVFIVSLMVMATVTIKFGNYDGVAAPSMDEAQTTILGTALCAFILSALFAERRQQAMRLEEALAAGAILTFDWDCRTDVVMRSNSAGQILGYDPRQTLDGKSFQARVHPDDIASLQALWSTLSPGNPSYSISYRFLRLDGREIWLQEKSKAEFDPAGRLMHVRGLARDVTERKRANVRTAADLDAMKRLHWLSVECARRENELKYCLDEIVETAIGIAGANKGIIQLFDQTSGTLKIAAQRGFEDPFLEHFACVSASTSGSASGIALKSRERVVVDDVTQNEIFAGTPSLNVLLDAGVRAGVWAPLISSSIKIFGVLSVHFNEPHRPGERELQLLDLLMRQASGYLARRSWEEEQQALVAHVKDDEHRVRAIVNTVHDGIITIDDNGIIETLNPAAARLFGYSPEEVVGNNIKILMPEPYRRDHDDYLSKYLTTGQARVIGLGREVAGQRRDGSIFPMELAVGEMTVAGRRMFTGVVRNITERKQVEEHQQELVAELDHRVKNVLARVLAVVKSTRQGSRSIDEFVQSYNGRIQSMATAHTLLSRTSWRGADLTAVVRNQLAPYATNANTTIAGTNIMLSAVATQALSMVLHELVTNAVKYGALSIPRGGVSVSWDRKMNGGASTTLQFLWREFDGPRATAAIQPGYGTDLIRNLIPHELGGTVDLVFASDGACCKIEFPLEHAADQEALLITPSANS
jgi:PAS domain S-box-containing protein